jgi:ABC-type nitrate/sulfonate/bicarbonate transport system substrate-binding protein
VDLAPTAVKQGLQLGSFNYSSYGVDTYGLGLFTRADLIQNKPDLVKSFVRGFWEASQFAAKNPEAGIDSFMKFNPQSDRALMLGEWKWAISVIGNQILTVKDPTSAGWIDQARMDTTAAIIAEGFGIPKLASAQLYTNNFSVQP